MRVRGKVALVTGGASGMGAASARRLRQEGAEVVITDVQTELGRSVAEAAGLIFIPHDVSDADGWTSVMQQVAERFGRLDIIMNNAGITGAGNIEDVTLHDWHRVISVNLTGVMLGCQHAIAAMRQNPGGPAGSIINVSSIAGLAGMASDAAYTASKGGVRLLTKSVAVHCARSGLAIRCNSIHPGAIDTPILSHALDNAPDRAALHAFLSNLSPMGRMGTGDDIAAMVVFLASDESAYVTGAEMLVDGGMMAQVAGL
jgi:NAD(P)-dependent dehydrogenase (short-subunit alcohol dehydrogenase family)